MSEQTPLRLLYDPVRRQPGCVLLQAAGGGDTALLQRLFPAQTWLVFPTKDLAAYVGTVRQWEHVARLKPRPVEPGVLDAAIARRKAERQPR